MSYRNTDAERKYSRERQRRKRAEDPEKIRQYQREWRKKHPEYYKLRSREYRKKDKDPVTAVLLELVKVLKAKGFLTDLEIIHKPKAK